MLWERKFTTEGTEDTVAGSKRGFGTLPLLCGSIPEAICLRGTDLPHEEEPAPSGARPRTEPAYFRLPR